MAAGRVRGHDSILSHLQGHTQLVLFIVLSLLLALHAFGQGSDRVVKVQGFVSLDKVKPESKFKVAIVIEVAEGYHINAHVPTLDYLIPTEVKLDPPEGIRTAEPLYPPPIHRSFQFAPQSKLAVHEGKVIIIADAEAEKVLPQTSPRTLVVRVTVQSCNDTLCLAPARLAFEIPIRFAASGEPVSEVHSDVFAEASLQLSGKPTGRELPPPALVQFGSETQPEKNIISGLIESRGLLFTLLFVFLSGLALNTTPCVYPIIPITIGFFANQSQGKMRRTLLMASLYVLGMAITYSFLGVLASMSKGLFGGALQKPWVLIGLAGLMVGLALSMFGVYEFRLPTLLNRFAAKNTQATAGMLGALVMGLMMGIVAAPCIGPFVLGLLVHVGTKGDAVYGFFMFFVLALGLGLPYLFLGIFSGALKRLPRSGEWMVTVRKVFGFVLIGMALYFLTPLLSGYSTIAFAAFFLVSALYLAGIEARRVRPEGFAWALRTLGLGAAIAAVVMVIPEKIEAGIIWQPYSEEALTLAKKRSKAVIIDAFADWCIPCKELDKFTFTHPEVKRGAGEFVTLKLDLTQRDPNSEANRARERFAILGVPTIIFIDPSGLERNNLRLEGFEEPEAFLARMRRLRADGLNMTSNKSNVKTASVQSDEALPAINNR